MPPRTKFFAYVGAKPWLIDQLLAVFHDLSFSVLVSPFAGTGVFEYALARAMPERQVQLYDTNAALVNFHQCYLQRQPELVESFQGSTALSKDKFLEWLSTFKDLQPVTCPSLHLATRYAIWQQHCFSGKSGSYVSGNRRRCPTRATRASPPLNLQVSCQDGLDALQRHLEQDLDTAYYLDPPYYVGERHYASGICRNFPRHRLAHLLHAHSSA